MKNSHTKKRFINPRVDFVFKIIFEKNTDLLISLINSIVSEADQVTEIEIKNPYNNKSRDRSKLSIVDIKAKSQDGTWFHIEVQVSDSLAYKKRALYYWSSVFLNQLEQKDPYFKLEKTISIHILNFIGLPEEKDYHNVFKVLNVKSHNEFADILEIHYIELKKIPEEMRYIKTALDRWAALLSRAENYTPQTLPPELKKDPLVEKAMRVFETTQLDDYEWENYQGLLKELHDEDARLIKATQNGFEEGEQKGREEGLQKGREEGALNATKKMVKNMSKKGVSIKEISNITDLSESDVIAILETNDPA
jgi:predicted transposase/invertase (TIGR01784 family)